MLFHTHGVEFDVDREGLAMGRMSGRFLVLVTALMTVAGLLTGSPVSGREATSDGDWIREREPSSPQVVRRAGADRFATAAAVSAARFDPGVSSVYVATGTSFPDALAGGPAAGLDGGPILLTLHGSLPGPTVDELERLEPQRVVVLGGTAVVSDHVERRLAEITGAPVDRLAGADRFETASVISADTFDPGVPTAYVATGSKFPDALAGGPVAADVGGPVLLTAKSTLPTTTAEELDRLNPQRIVVLGGAAAIEDGVVDALSGYTDGQVARRAGADRFATAVAVSRGRFETSDVAYLTTGLDFPDALTGTPAAVVNDAPLLLTPSDCIPGDVRGEIERVGAERVVVLGGTNAVGETAAALEPCSSSPLPTFEVDTSLEPLADAPDEQRGQISFEAIEDEHGTRVDLVADEVIVVGDQGVLDDFLDRWGGELIETVDPSDHGSDAPSQHRVRVDPSQGDPSGLPEDIRTIEPYVTAHHRASSEDALGLLAIAAAEVADGRRVAVNLVADEDGYIDGDITESENRNPFKWQHFDRSREPHTGVVDAWRALAKLGVTDPAASDRVPVAILDGGFAKELDSSSGSSLDPEWPPGTVGDTWDVKSPRSDSWHGTNVAQTAFGMTDNGRGAAGTGGPVAKGMMRQVGKPTGTALPKHLFRVIGQGARVANISISADLPATVAWSGDALETALFEARVRGTLVVASAGNDGKDLDEQDCFIACWEKQKTWPCEMNKVVCVGGTERQSLDRHKGSNYGDEVTLAGPYTNWVGPAPNQTTDKKYDFSGTSGSAPFVSGVAALVVAADPSLTAPQIEDVLHRAAESANDELHKSVRAYEAVVDVIGQEPADVTIDEPSPGTSVKGGERFEGVASVTTHGGGDPNLSWTFAGSDEGTGTAVSIDTTGIDPGTYPLELHVDDGPYDYTLSVDVTVTNVAPTMTIDSPDDGSTYYESSTIYLEATSDDPNEPGSTLSDSQVEWYRESLSGSRDSSPLATGHSAQITGSDLGVGDHRLVVVGDDGQATGEDSVEITVQNDPSDNVPPSVNILQPEDGEYKRIDDYHDGKGWATFTFEGEASDPEDGQPSGSSFHWTATSDDGHFIDLGTGAGPFEDELHTKAESYYVRTWTVELTVTDSDGAQTSETVEVHVQFSGT